MAWRLVDSQYWGTPQRRKRIFLVGDFRAERAPQILFECESVLGYTETRGKERKGITPVAISNFEVAGGLDPNSCIADFGRTADRIYYNAEKARTLTATTGGGGSATGNYLDTSAVYPIRDPQLNQNANGFIVGNESDPAPTLSATDRHAIAAHFVPSDKPISVANSSGNGIAGTLDSNYYRGTGARSGKEREFIGVVKPIGITQTVDDLNKLVTCFAPSSYGTYKEGFGPLRQTGFGDSENLLVIFKKIAYWVKYELRRLTPLECERLQGLPDYWTKYDKSGAVLPDTPRYKAIGNSLTVPCAERIFRGIMAVI